MSYPDYELNEPTTGMNILKMLELIYKTLNSENEPNKVFYIKIPSNSPTNYLNYDKKDDSYFLSGKYELDDFQTKFTQEEIYKMEEDSKLSWLNINHCKVLVEEDE